MKSGFYYEGSKLWLRRNIEKEIARVTKIGGYVITCGWNSGGIGKTNGFEIIEILLVAHGGWYNDTIVTVERKIKLTWWNMSFILWKGDKLWINF